MEAVSLGTALLFVVCGIVRSNLAPKANKHEKLNILAEKKLSKISELVSKTLYDHVITDEEYSIVLSELNTFKDKKEQIRSEAKKCNENETSLVNKFKKINKTLKNCVKNCDKNFVKIILLFKNVVLKDTRPKEKRLDRK